MEENPISKTKCQQLESQLGSSSIRNYRGFGLVLKYISIIYFMALVSFYTPWKHQKAWGFSMFFGGIKRSQWHDMGLTDHITSDI